MRINAVNRQTQPAFGCEHCSKSVAVLMDNGLDSFSKGTRYVREMTHKPKSSLLHNAQSKMLLAHIAAAPKNFVNYINEVCYRFSK
jgi:hypothetical protein